MQNLEEDLEGLIVHYENQDVAPGAGSNKEKEKPASAYKQNLGRIKSIVSNWLSRNSA